LAVDEKDPLDDLADRVLNLRARDAIRTECEALIRDSSVDGELPADRAQRDAAHLSVLIDEAIQEKGLGHITSARDWDAACKKRAIFMAEQEAVQHVLDAAIAYLQLESTGISSMPDGKWAHGEVQSGHDGLLPHAQVYFGFARPFPTFPCALFNAF
jgi:hypothetical protein